MTLQLLYPMLMLFEGAGKKVVSKVKKGPRHSTHHESSVTGAHSPRSARCHAMTAFDDAFLLDDQAVKCRRSLVGSPSRILTQPATLALTLTLTLTLASNRSFARKKKTKDRLPSPTSLCSTHTQWHSRTLS